MRLVKSKVFMMPLSASIHEVLTWNIPSAFFCTEVIHNLHVSSKQVSVSHTVASDSMLATYGVLLFQKKRGLSRRE